MFPKLLLFSVLSYLGYHYCSTIFENTRFFSHLSTLEREMAFRTEAGFYYMFFKTIVEAPTFLEGWSLLVNDSGTEYPSHINTLQRFNVYPEVLLGGAFRVFRSVVTDLDMMSYFKQCYWIDRAEGMSKVESCVGAGDLTMFYINCIFTLSGLEIGVLFLIGCQMSENILGGILTASAAFFNFAQCSRVYRIPPLRENYSCPFLLLQVLLVSRMLKSGHSRGLQVSLVLATACCALPWQFSQFVLFTQTLSLFGSYSLSFLNKNQLSPILDCIFIGYSIATVFQFLNTMLISSLYVSSYLAFKMVIFLNRSGKMPNRILQFVKDVVLFLLVAGVYKTGSAWLLQHTDDAHIFNILRSKITDYRDFDTLLYTCAKDFDFIELEVLFKLVPTLLLPTTAVILLRLVYIFGRALFNKSEQVTSSVDEHPQENTKESGDKIAEKRKKRRLPKNLTISSTVTKPEVSVISTHGYLTYHMFQFGCYLGMALILARLKLLMTTQMCILFSLVASSFVLPLTQRNRWVYFYPFA